MCNPADSVTPINHHNGSQNQTLWNSWHWTSSDISEHVNCFVVGASDVLRWNSVLLTYLLYLHWRV